MQPNLLTMLSPTNIIILAVIFTRISGMIFSMPIVSTYPIPQQVKIWLCALVSFLLFPMVAGTMGVSVPQSIPELTLYLLREFSIGYLIGFCANFLSLHRFASDY